MKIADLKQPYRRMAEYFADKNTDECYDDKKVLCDAFNWEETNDNFWNDINEGYSPLITEGIKQYFPPDFDFSGEKGFVYPYDKNYLKIPINEHSTLLIPKDDLMEKTSNEEKIVYWAKNLEHKSLSLHELVEEGKWLVSHCSNIEDNKQYYTQLAKEGKFYELPDTCEFSEAVELEVWDNELQKKRNRLILGKFKGAYLEEDLTAWHFAQLPTPKIDFLQFKEGDVVEVETISVGYMYGYIREVESDKLLLSLGYMSDVLRTIRKEKIKSITKIK